MSPIPNNSKYIKGHKNDFEELAVLAWLTFQP
jgi:hypothetical protein